MNPKVVRTNWTNEDLWCIYSKERIQLGEKYITVFEEYDNETIEKNYKIDYIDCIEDEE